MNNTRIVRLSLMREILVNAWETTWRGSSSSMLVIHEYGGHYRKAFFAQQLGRYRKAFFPQLLKNIHKCVGCYRKAYLAHQLGCYPKAFFSQRLRYIHKYGSSYKKVYFAHQLDVIGNPSFPNSCKLFINMATLLESLLCTTVESVYIFGIFNSHGHSHDGTR